MRHGLQLADINLLWLAGLNISWDCLSCNGWVSMTSMTSWNSHHFSGTTYSPLCTAIMTGNLPAVSVVHRDCERVYGKSTVSLMTRQTHEGPFCSAKPHVTLWPLLRLQIWYPIILVNSVQLIWRSVRLRQNLQISFFSVSCSNFDEMSGSQFLSWLNARTTCSIIYIHIPPCIIHDK